MNFSPTILFLVEQRHLIAYTFSVGMEFMKPNISCDLSASNLMFLFLGILLVVWRLISTQVQLKNIRVTDELEVKKQ